MPNEARALLEQLSVLAESIAAGFNDLSEAAEAASATSAIDDLVGAPLLAEMTDALRMALANLTNLRGVAASATRAVRNLEAAALDVKERSGESN